MKGVLIVWIILWGAIASGCESGTARSAIWGYAPLPPTPEPRHVAKVTRVVSGHTIEVQPNGHTSTLNQTVRLIGIQSPDHAQIPWGPNAQSYLETLLLGQMVQLSLEPAESAPNSTEGLAVAEVDEYGRQWAYVWFKDQLVNQQLIADGIVLVEERSPHLEYVQQFSHAQYRARILGLGIWNPHQPMRQTPSEFRQQQD